MYSIEEYDKEKTKVLKYVLYKKRTEVEIRRKFSGSIEENLLEDVLAELKENGYISDEEYIQRAIREYTNLKSLSRKELRYKLYAKGIAPSLLEEYFSKNMEELEEYELQSAKKIAIKKQGEKDAQEIADFLRKKGYDQEIIRKVALPNIE